MSDDVEIVFVTPQFNRSPKEPAPKACPSAEELALLCERSSDELRALGLGCWNNPGEPDEDGHPLFRRNTLWLFPAEWCESIPDGFEVVTISGRREAFKRGETDDDRRFGCLAYGILVPWPTETA